MRKVIHKLLVLCGVAIVVLRFSPTEPGGWVSKLFLDEIIYDRLHAWSVKAMSGLGTSLDAYQTHMTQLASLAHLVVIIAQAGAIALIFYIITRRI